jgi:beta-galactosidase
LRRNLKEIYEAFPDKPIVISEYGYCACTADRREGDVRRGEVLTDHTAVARELDFVGGSIFFCFNDYRTHIGDKGTGTAKQRIHGVVDLYGNKKSSYDGLRFESSPIESLQVSGHPADFAVTLTTRKTMPAYQITGYKLRAVFYGYEEIPLERREAELSPLEPGKWVTIGIKFSEKEPLRVEFDVLRSTGFSAYRKVWRA